MLTLFLISWRYPLKWGTGSINSKHSLWLADLFIASTARNGQSFCLCWFYGPVNPKGSCRVWSVYLTTRLLGRLSPLSVNQSRAHSFARNWQLPFLNQWKGESDRRKYFTINLHERLLPNSAGLNLRPPGLHLDGASNWATDAGKAHHEVHCEQSELYGRDYDQGKVTYRNIYFQQNRASINFQTQEVPDFLAL